MFFHHQEMITKMAFQAMVSQASKYKKSHIIKIQLVDIPVLEVPAKIK